MKADANTTWEGKGNYTSARKEAKKLRHLDPDGDQSLPSFAIVLPLENISPSLRAPIHDRLGYHHGAFVVAPFF